jgi:hypothetical protein
MKLMQQIRTGLVLLAVAPLWAQVSSAPAQSAPAAPGTSTDNASGAATTDSDRMQTPPQVNGMAYATDFTSEERSNYVRAGITFTSAYSDNAIGSVNGQAVSDISYSIMPTVAFDKTTPRLHAVVSYAPGFTFYQRESSRNEADQSASINFQYRLSPHVTLSAGDSFQKSSNVFNQPDPTDVAVTGGTQSANFSVIAPIADRLTNTGNVGIGYQFGRDSMIGASGNFSNLHYPDSSEVPGLYDSSSQGGSLFVSFRASEMNYFGATYQYQRLLAYPVAGVNETQTHAILFFYTLYPTSRFSISVFGGPQYSDTVETTQPPTPEARAWTPAAGASVSWQGRLNSVAVSYAKQISGGGGLSGAVQRDSANVVLRQRIVPNLTAGVSGSYSNNQALDSELPGSTNGHSLQATATLEQQFGQHLSAVLGYTRLHQTYSNVAVFASTPDTNREFVSLSYQFSRPLGR